ncbi:MAG: STAS domain-containing protein [Treponema sp.]|jgi:anti-anti-sigma factor|nr:STAS domain-containing protein [Treponema sp.]
MSGTNFVSNSSIVPGFDDDRDENLKITLQTVPDIEGCLILYLSGYVDTYNAHAFQRRIAKAISAGYTKLIFQCSGLKYVSSAGIGSFSNFVKSIKSQGGNLVLVNIAPAVYEVFQLLGFAEIFHVKDDLDGAFEFFKGGGEAPVFPRVIPCPICLTNLKVVKPGHFRCSECKSVLTVSDAGQASLG